MAAMKRRDEVLQRNKGMAKKHPDVLIARYIEQNPRRPWAEEARLKERGVAVWALIGYLRGVDNDVQQTADDYELPIEAIEAAIAYYRRHRAAINARLAPSVFD